MGCPTASPCCAAGRGHPFASVCLKVLLPAHITKPLGLPVGHTLWGGSPQLTPKSVQPLDMEWGGICGSQTGVPDLPHSMGML